MGGILVVVLGVIVGVVVLGLLVLAWRTRAEARLRRSRSRPRTSRHDPDAVQLRQTVIDQASAHGIRVPVARSGLNPMVVTYTVGPPVNFYASLDAYRRDIDPQSVDPDYASWGRAAPALVAEWTGDECRNWLADH